jgi:hypothetical protein
MCPFFVTQDNSAVTGGVGGSGGISGNNITSYSFSNNGQTWTQIKATSSSAVSGVTTALFQSPLPGGLSTSNLLVKVTNLNGQTSNAIAAKQVPLCANGQGSMC